MYVHIGKDFLIKTEDIIGIFDIESIKNTPEYETIIKQLKSEKSIIDFSEGIDKTLILVKEKKKCKAYISNISSLTLNNRV